MENIWEVKNRLENRQEEKRIKCKIRTCERIAYICYVCSTLNTDIICMCNTPIVLNGYNKQTYLRHRLCVYMKIYFILVY